MKKVIQIIESKTGNIIHEVDVTGYNERAIDRIESGMNTNLNHDQYHTNEAEVEDRELINWQDKKPNQ